jgi:4-amino-4-deoxy-L-arabinose transferase-like glycosyltransferase
LKRNAVLAGTAFLLWRRPRGTGAGLLLVMAWFLPVAAATLSFQVKFIRYLAPLIPFLCVMGAAGLWAIRDSVRSRGGKAAVTVIIAAVVGVAASGALGPDRAAARRPDLTTGLQSPRPLP